MPRFNVCQILSPLLLASLSNLDCFAEIDNFDMALTGGFQQDYCTFSITDNDLLVDLDTTSNQMQNFAGSNYFEVNWGVIIINCTDGSYTVTASFPEESSMHDNVKTLNFVNISRTPSYNRYVDYRFTRTFSVENGIWGYIYPSVFITSLDSSVEAFPESYNVLLPLTIKVDAL